MPVEYRKYLDPEIVGKLKGMELKARMVVEGFIAGMHKSPYHGFSVEFAEHRQYMPGDNIRDIDWKVYAKSDRYYIKQYEEETNLKAYLLLDCSASMKYSSGGAVKHDYAATLAAADAPLSPNLVPRVEDDLRLRRDEAHRVEVRRRFHRRPAVPVA